MKGVTSLHDGKVDDLATVPDEGGTVGLAAEGGSTTGPVPDEGRLLPDLCQAEWLAGLCAVRATPK